MTDQLTTRLILALIVASAATGCSFVVDTGETQCTIDADCARFSSHPSCRAGVCVVSDLGPPGCFSGDPQTAEQFANQCTSAQTLQFDNCGRLGLCDSNALAKAMSSTITPPVQGAPPAPIDPPPKPTLYCSDLVGGNIIYITGSTNLPPLLQAVQPLLSADSPAYTAVFAPRTSCTGAASVYAAAASSHLIINVENSPAFFYDKDGVQTFCLLDNGGNTVDVGESDVYPQSCGYSSDPDIGDYTGPIQAIAFVVPSGSKQTAISAEAAHLVFATGGAGGTAAPWTDPRLYFVRSQGTGTTQLPSKAIILDPSAWWGVDRSSASNLVRSMEAVNPSTAEAAVGILSSDFADKARANVRELAFQQQGQRYAYLPDSTPESLDKANVRDGHYPIWGAVHLLAPAPGGVADDRALALITKLTVAKLDQTLVSKIIDAGFIPPCAMKVTHGTEVGPLSAIDTTTAFQCGCFFEQQVNNATSCQACRGSSDCPSETPSCNYGFCEKK
jgi:hypothetical protein